MIQKRKEKKIKKKHCWIFDVDGTLVNVDSVIHWITNKDREHESFKKYYDMFHTESINCDPHKEVIDMVWSACNDSDIVIVTARNENYRALTSRWLKNNNVPHDALFMRKENDFRSDYEIKKEILEKINEYWDVKHAVDDNPDIINLWESNGIPTTKIGTWDGVKR